MADHQPSLFPSFDHAAASRATLKAASEPLPDHDGKTYDSERDKVRLNKQLQAVYAVLSHVTCWMTLAEIAAAAECGEASASARLRDLRKQKFGGHRVDGRRRAGADGLWEYRLVS